MKLQKFSKDQTMSVKYRYTTSGATLVIWVCRSCFSTINLFLCFSVDILPITRSTASALQSFVSFGLRWALSFWEQSLLTYPWRRIILVKSKNKRLKRSTSLATSTSLIATYRWDVRSPRIKSRTRSVWGTTCTLQPALWRTSSSNRTTQFMTVAKISSAQFTHVTNTSKSSSRLYRFCKRYRFYSPIRLSLSTGISTDSDKRNSTRAFLSYRTE